MRFDVPQAAYYDCQLSNQLQYFTSIIALFHTLLVISGTPDDTVVASTVAERKQLGLRKESLVVVLRRSVGITES